MPSKTEKIDLIQKEYFNFCTALIKKIPMESTNVDALMTRAFEYRDALEKEIIRGEIDCKREAILEIEKEIELIKIELQKNGTN